MAKAKKENKGITNMVKIDTTELEKELQMAFATGAPMSMEIAEIKEEKLVEPVEKAEDFSLENLLEAQEGNTAVLEPSAEAILADLLSHVEGGVVDKTASTLQEIPPEEMKKLEQEALREAEELANLEKHAVEEILAEKAVEEKLPDVEVKNILEINSDELEVKNAREEMAKVSEEPPNVDEILAGLNLGVIFDKPSPPAKKSRKKAEKEEAVIKTSVTEKEEAVVKLTDIVVPIAEENKDLVAVNEKVYQVTDINIEPVQEESSSDIQAKAQELLKSINVPFLEGVKVEKPKKERKVKVPGNIPVTVKALWEATKNNKRWAITHSAYSEESGQGLIQLTAKKVYLIPEDNGEITVICHYWDKPVYEGKLQAKDLKTAKDEMRQYLFRKFEGVH